jgi:hypothetical protein
MPSAYEWGGMLDLIMFYGLTLSTSGHLMRELWRSVASRRRERRRDGSEVGQGHQGAPAGRFTGIAGPKDCCEHSGWAPLA